VKFIVFVEGHTEKKALPDFIRRWLDARLPQRLGLKTVRFEGWPELWRGAPRKARLYLNGPGNEDIIGVISLLDLYGPTIYPKNKQTAQERCDWAKAEMERQVGLPGFRQFLAVHETEAWLLSQPAIFPEPVRDGFPGNTKHPETVDFDEPPAKLLDRLYRNRLKQTYKKVTHGKALFDKLDPNDAYARCPRLKELFDEMLAMASEALSK